MKPIGLVYPEDVPPRILFSEKMRRAVQDQVKDNKLAMEAHLQHISFQVSDGSIDSKDLLTLLCEMPLQTSAITDNFDLTKQELMCVRSAEPISIISCLECRTHLPDGNRQTFLRQLRIIRYLAKFEVGNPIKLDTLCEVLCDSCAQEMQHCHQEQCRTESLARQARKAQLCGMSPEKYRKTPEYQSRRNQVLIRAGNRCQLCHTSAKPLDVHHNSYDRFGDELLVDLVVLCRRCHQHFHGNLPQAA